MRSEDDSTLIEYYLKKYDIEVKNKRQPLLVTESKKGENTNPIYLVPELMLMTGIPDNFDERRRR